MSISSRLNTCSLMSPTDRKILDFKTCVDQDLGKIIRSKCTKRIAKEIYKGNAGEVIEKINNKGLKDDYVKEFNRVYFENDGFIKGFLSMIGSYAALQQSKIYSSKIGMLIAAPLLVISSIYLGCKLKNLNRRKYINMQLINY